MPYRALVSLVPFQTTGTKVSLKGSVHNDFNATTKELSPREMRALMGGW